jgi:hypothetical protein
LSFSPGPSANCRISNKSCTRLSVSAAISRDRSFGFASSTYGCCIPRPCNRQSTHSDVHVDHRPADAHCNVHAAGEPAMGPQRRFAMSEPREIAQLHVHDNTCLSPDCFGVKVSARCRGISDTRYGVVVTLVNVYLGNDFCIPYDGTPGPTNGQFMRVVVQYIDQRPARLHENFHNLAHEALRAAWPCKN